MTGMEVATQALIAYPNTKGYDDAIDKFTYFMRGKITHLQFRKSDVGVAVSLTIEFVDYSKIRLTKFTNKTTGLVNLHLKKVG